VLRTLRAVRRALTRSGPEPCVPSSSGVDTAKASTTEKLAHEPSLCRSRRVVGGADRAKPIPFEVKFWGTDKEIRDYADILVKGGGAGILNWMLDGMAQYREKGLAHPEDVQDG